MQRARLIILLIFWQGIVWSQSLCFPEQDVMAHVYNSSEVSQASMRPIFNTQGLKTQILKPTISDRLWNTQALSISDSLQGFWMRADLDMNLQLGKSLTDTGIFYTNGRGLWVRCGIGKNVRFETIFSEYQARPDYAQARYYAGGTVPGFGRWKTFGTQAYDFAASMGVLAIQVRPRMHISLGQGKHHVGYGYRSMLWSDYMPGYPFARIQLNSKHNVLKYEMLWAALSAFPQKATHRSTEALFLKSAAAFQLLEWQPIKTFRFCFFQGISSRASGFENKPRLNVSFANPVLFSNALAFGLSDTLNNVTLGAQGHWQASSNLSFYAQTQFDKSINNAKASVFAYQAGMHFYYKSQQTLLHVQFEWNALSNKLHQNEVPRHYAMRWSTLQGPGQEMLCRFQWRYKRLLVTAHTAQSFTIQNAFTTDARSKSYLINTEWGCLLNPERRWILAAGFQNLTHLNASNNAYLYVSLKSQLYNWYNDIR